MSLRARFLTLFAVFAVVPLVALGIFNYIESMRALEALIATQTEAIAARVATHVEQGYALRESELRLLSQNVETQRLYRALGGGNPDDRDEALDRASAYLRQAWDVLGSNYVRLEFRDAGGGPIYRLPAYASAGSGALGGVYRRHVMSVVRPIQDASGREVGSLVATLDLDELLPLEQLAERFGETGYSMVVDRSRNTVVYHPRHALRDQSLGTLFGPGGWNVDASVLGREDGTFVYREHDTTRVAAFVSLAEPPWTVLAAGSVQEFSGPISRLRARGLAIVFLAAAAVALAFTLMLRRETRSLLALTAAADRVGGGDLDPDLPQGASGEVGRLSAAFGLMVARVRETLRQIETSRQMAVVGEFASQIAHEIRNPLTSMKLNMQSLARDVKSGRIPEESAPPIKISLREIERLDRVVSGVLSLGRPRSEAREPLPIGEILGGALDVLTAQAREQGIQVETRCDTATFPVTGNAEELRGAFLNLFLNAMEAMPEGGTLRVSTRPLPAGDIEVRIADDGPGIPEALREEIFRPFHTSKRGGTGLGLSLALRTFEEHGGSLAVAGSPGTGQGAELVVTLPRASGAGS